MKKKFKTMIALFAIILISQSSVMAEKKKKEVKEINIQTSAVCGMCEERLEHNMKFEKGVIFVDLDPETKKLQIKYRADKTNPDKLRKAISKIGYDADDVLADQKAYDKLPACCKKDVAPH